MFTIVKKNLTTNTKLDMYLPARRDPYVKINIYLKLIYTRVKIIHNKY